jgi:phage tail sheath protein FI
MDSLYDNNINPIRWKRGSGIMIWGQKTLQTRQSDLSYMNARVTLCVIKPAITALLEQFLFDMNTLSNTTGTRALINAVITTYMNNVVANGGCYDFEVICNSTNNSAFDVQSHTLNVWLLVHITDDIEYIPFSIGVVGFSISFDIAQGLL